MKRILIIIGDVITLLFFGSLLVCYVLIDQGVKRNITIAKQKYSGTAENALISFLLDENNATNDRTHIAIWTLGRIRSKKALPILKSYYKNDPEGKTCYGKHHLILCQYEIHKAIVKIDTGMLFSSERLKNK